MCDCSETHLPWHQYTTDPPASQSSFLFVVSLKYPVCDSKPFPHLICGGYIKTLFQFQPISAQRLTCSVTAQLHFLTSLSRDMDFLFQVGWAFSWEWLSNNRIPMWLIQWTQWWSSHLLFSYSYCVKSKDCNTMLTWFHELYHLLCTSYDLW